MELPSAGGLSKMLKEEKAADVSLVPEHKLVKQVPVID